MSDFKANMRQIGVFTNFSRNRMCDSGEWRLSKGQSNTKQVATVMVATDSIVTAAQIILLYSPGGANVITI